MKKAQVEIIGLSIIIILVALIFFAVLIFRANNSGGQNYKENIQMKEYARQFVTTFHATQTPCHAIMGDYIEDCISGDQSMCGDKRACALVEAAAESILSETLDKWGIIYSFNITGTDISIMHGNCTAKTPSFGAGVQKIPVFLGYADDVPQIRQEEMVLKICQ